MSSISTILLTNCCHIYEDAGYQYQESLEKGIERVLVIGVSYGSIKDGGDDNDFVVVDYESDFSAMIRFMIEKCGADEIDEYCRAHWRAKNDKTKTMPQPQPTR